MNRRLFALALVAAVVVTACSGDDDASDAGAAAGDSPTTTAAPAADPTTTTTVACTSDLSLERVDLTVAGVERHAFVRLPAGWDGSTPAPMVLSFHGASSNAEQQMTFSGGGMVEAASDEGYIAVFPDGRPDGLGFTSGWALTDPAEADFVAALLDVLTSDLCVDVSRVYANGLSNGGGMTFRMSCALADRFAAVAAVVPQLPTDLPCAPSRPVPMMAFAGVEDALLPYAGGGASGQQPFEEWGAAYAARNGCEPGASEDPYAATVEELTWSGCDAPVVLYRVHGNGHAWPGHAFAVDREVLVAALSGGAGGGPNPIMQVLGLTPEQMADNITLVNTDIDATARIFEFYAEHALDDAGATE